MRDDINQKLREELDLCVSLIAHKLFFIGQCDKWTFIMQILHVCLLSASSQTSACVSVLFRTLSICACDLSVISKFERWRLRL